MKGEYCLTDYRVQREKESPLTGFLYGRKKEEKNSSEYFWWRMQIQTC